MNFVANPIQPNTRIYKMRIVSIFICITIAFSGLAQDSAALFKSAITKAQAGDMPGAIADF
ncbi:MAG: hypothetical protein ACPGU4_14610, partial [Flavobacteriales bacterium]